MNEKIEFQNQKHNVQVHGHTLYNGRKILNFKITAIVVIVNLHVAHALLLSSIVSLVVGFGTEWGQDNETWD